MPADRRIPGFSRVGLAAALLAGTSACAGLFGLDPGAPGDAPADAATDGAANAPVDGAGAAPDSPSDASPSDASPSDASDDGAPPRTCDRTANPPTPFFFCTGYDEDPPVAFGPTVAEGVFSLVSESPRSAPRVLRARTAPLTDQRQRSFKLDFDGTAGRLAATFAVRVVEDPQVDDARLFALEHDEVLYELEIRRRDGGTLEIAYVANGATFQTFTLARRRWVPVSVRLTTKTLDLDVDGQTVGYVFPLVPLRGLLVRWGFERAGDAGIVDFDDVRFDAR